MILFKDIRDYQILYLSLFLILGIGTRDWTLRPSMIVVTIATSLVMQSLLTFIVNRWSFADDQENKEYFEHKINIRSPLITSLGISLLLRADYPTTMFVAAACAIASKFVFKFEDKHFFNPANFGIISALVLTPDAWVSPGQWGEDWWYAFLFVGTGGMILHRIGRWDTTAAFLGFYALLEAVRNLWLNWTWDVYLHRLMSGSLLLFALFMVTDPSFHSQFPYWQINMGCLHSLINLHSAKQLLSSHSSILGIICPRTTNGNIRPTMESIAVFVEQ